MAKESYQIPYSLNSSYLDMEISIQNNHDGIGIRPFPIRNILFVVGSVFLAIIILAKTFIGYGTILQKLIFLIVWALLSTMLLLSGKTKILGIEKISSIFEYLQKESRSVETRTMSKAGPFIRLTGFTHIDEKGIIHYIDGSYGVVYDIVGTASILLFQNHKERIIDRVDSFYRKMQKNVTYHYVTKSEAQSVYYQVGSLLMKEKKLTVEDPELLEMIHSEQTVLSKIIGSEYKSLHQYMLIQAPSKEELRIAINIFLDEYDSSSQVFKFVEQLEMDEAEEFMQSFYRGADRSFVS